MQATRERSYSSYSCLTSALDAVSVSFTPRPRSTAGIHWIRGWVGLRAVGTQRLEEKSFASAGTEPRSPGSLVSTQALCWRNYRSSWAASVKTFEDEVVWADNVFTLNIVLNYLHLSHLLSPISEHFPYFALVYCESTSPLPFHRSPFSYLLVLPFSVYLC
jgi:hypothetical protein